MKKVYSIQVLISVVLWSFSFIWTKGALEYLSPVMLVSFRVWMALLFILTFSMLTGRLQRVTPNDLRIFMGLSAVEPVGYFMLETTGVNMVSPTLACIIVSTIPLFSPLVAYLINGERASRGDIIRLLVSMTGVFLVVASGSESLSGKLAGVAILFGATTAAIIYTVTVQRLATRYNSFTIVAYQNIFAGSYLVPLLLIFDWRAVSTLSFDWAWAGNVLTLAILCSGIAFVLYANSIRTLGVTKTSTFVNLMPSFTAIASYFIFGESLGVVKVLGIVLTITGLLLRVR